MGRKGLLVLAQLAVCMCSGAPVPQVKRGLLLSPLFLAAACQNCIQMDTATLAGLLVASLGTTVFLALAVSKIAAQEPGRLSRGEGGSGGRGAGSSHSGPCPGHLAGSSSLLGLFKRLLSWLPTEQAWPALPTNPRVLLCLSASDKQTLLANDQLYQVSAPRELRQPLFSRNCSSSEGLHPAVP